MHLFLSKFYTFLFLGTKATDLQDISFLVECFRSGLCSGSCMLSDTFSYLYTADFSTAYFSRFYLLSARGLTQPLYSTAFPLQEFIFGFLCERNNLFCLSYCYFEFLSLSYDRIKWIDTRNVLKTVSSTL